MKSYYFNQTQEWASFWLQANKTGHDIHYISTQELGCYVYEYPFFMGKKFWYIPRGVNLLQAESVATSHYWLDSLIALKTKIQEQAKLHNVSYIKLELAQDYLLYVAKDRVEEIRRLTSVDVWNEISFHWQDSNFRMSAKKIQYLQTVQLDLTDLVGGDESKLSKLKSQVKQTLGLAEAGVFFQSNKKWFDVTLDKRTRYGTRKGLDKNWTISFEKSEQNFEDFYSLHKSTGERQSFGVHQKEYLQTLFLQDFSRIIILRGEDGVAAAGWFGIALDGTLTNLYGGNNQYSRNNYGQYLLHLCAIILATQEGCNYYDVGGLEEGKGFDLFKQGYKGRIVNFYGPYDLVLDSLSYGVYNLMRGLRNLKFWPKP